MNRATLGEQTLRLGDQNRVVVAQEQRAVAADEIEDADLFTVPPVIQIVALCPLEHHADPKQIEQLTQLRFDQLIEVVSRVRLHGVHTDAFGSEGVTGRGLRILESTRQRKRRNVGPEKPPRTRAV